MHQHSSFDRSFLPLTLTILAAVLAAGPLAAQPAPADQVRAGERLPGGRFELFNPGNDATTVDLTPVIGAKPIVLFYWIPGNRRADQIFVELLDVTRQLDPAKLAVYGVAVPNPGFGLTADVVRQKIDALGIDVPVLHDEGFAIGKALGVRSVPNVTIVDRAGILRLSNGASLAQVLGYKVDLTAAIERVANTGELMTYGYLDRYFPVKELEGKPAPDFTAPLLNSSVEQSLDGLIDDGKLTVLIFWSVDCPHCRKSLPEISGWLQEHPEGLNVVSCAAVNNATTKQKTREFCKANDLTFPTLVDQDAAIGSLYGVTSTPTIVIIGPDGVVSDALISTFTDFGDVMERRKKELLKPARSG